MKPDINFITIHNNEAQIKALLEELVLNPRINALKWSKITYQTPNLKIGYPGQHLASLITGVKGSKTAARGDDLEDGTEVKSCSRIDQMDKCKDCESPVARSEKVCSVCGSNNIQRKDDSKWLFTIKSENDLQVITQDVKRVLLILGDYPNFDNQDYDTLRFQCFEIWTQSIRNRKFKEILSNYYYKIYLPKKNSGKTPDPKNFWPYQYQFYLCNPILTFSCYVYNASIQPEIDIKHYIKPQEDRSNFGSELMPIEILNRKEKELLQEHLNVKNEKDLPQFINEDLREILPLRDTDKGFKVNTPHIRKSSKKR
ncbi:MamI family restriction endonuclease [Sphaerospermopsis torques-reginae]|uniref:MamI family restriction endonuclease n=1 Tax=Sphaerospermopsis torques-reginae ITEP-024 TaxID=984208 RepID=A0ABX8WZU3_9CYAN|nr:MamI family restriction endonuclease [Sphaerospermopsis torques-reginae]QYX31965.1 MamI family restriction endonuclease [Sphaerospermopsis torques-reginae ITEP-024]